MSSLFCTAAAHLLLGRGAATAIPWGIFGPISPSKFWYFVFLDNREVWKWEAQEEPTFAGRAVGVVRVLGKRVRVA